MPRGSRRAKRAADGHVPLDLERARGGAPRRQAAMGGEFMVSPPRPAAKRYICPGCGRWIEPGNSQVAVIEADPLLGPTTALELRRHWHTGCWAKLAG